MWQARMATQAPEIDGVCYIEDFGETEPKPGQFRRMRITAAHDYDLKGDLIDAPPPEMAGGASNPFRILSAALVHGNEGTVLPHR